MSTKKRLRRSFPMLLVIVLVFAGGILFEKWTSPALGKGHEAAHEGVLNVIGEEIGHAEIRLSGDLVEVWFVGGGNDTHRAVPIKADSIKLTVEKELVLNAAPLVLAGESKGNCSHFTARAGWLGAMEEFTAHGDITFKGREFELLIHYPHGYDPHHGGEHEHEHEH